MTQYILDNDSRLTRLGRHVDLGEGWQTGWQGSQIRFKVSGTTTLEVNCSIADVSTSNNAKIGINIDGAAIADFELSSLANIYTGAASHTFTLPDATEHEIILRLSQYPSFMWVPSVNKNILVSLGIDDAGTLTEWSQGGRLTVGCVGDSWMGWFNDWPYLLDSAQFNIWPLGFGGATGATLDAQIDYQYSGVAASGDPTMDAVFVNSSVNDYNASVSDAAFLASISSLVDKLRVQQPSARILLIQSPDNTGAGKLFGQYGTQMAICASTRDNVYYMPNTGTESYTWADDSHLDYASRQALATLVGDFYLMLEEAISMTAKINKLGETYLMSRNDINYHNPIAANSTASITPVSGAYYTSTSKLVTITSSSGTAQFQPGADLSRVIWGTGAGAAITLTVNPSALSVGEHFCIKAEGGESRVLMWDGTNFQKEGGVVLPLSCKMHYNATALVSVSDSTLTKLNLDTTDSDPSGQMADPTTTYRINLIRGGFYNVQANIQWGDLSSTHTLDHETQTRAKYTGSLTSYRIFNGYIHAGQNLGEGASFGSTDLPALIAGDYLELYGYHVTVGTAESLYIYGPTANNLMSVREVDPW